MASMIITYLTDTRTTFARRANTIFEYADEDPQDYYSTRVDPVSPGRYGTPNSPNRYGGNTPGYSNAYGGYQNTSCDYRNNNLNFFRLVTVACPVTVYANIVFFIAKSSIAWRLVIS